MTRLLMEALLRLAHALAALDRKDRLQEWREECQDVDNPLAHAAGFVRSAAQSHPPFNSTALELATALPSDIKTLRNLKLAIVLLGITLVFMVGLLMLVGPTDTTTLWFVRAGVLLSIAAIAIWTGFQQDLPWLRATRAGSGLMLSAVFLPPLLLTVLHVWPTWGSAWIATSFVLMAWDSYWSVQRPLKRRGLISR
ncbi:hypothetical protein [Deinococcus aquatilis]|uniref:hypothetical protein n=1 Tax=Deinococcus aquatilis TaxID=519440 RepID=UPI00036812C6|nr:hypothetical protein [Deinococcus aquatilis]